MKIIRSSSVKDIHSQKIFSCPRKAAIPTHFIPVFGCFFHPKTVPRNLQSAWATESTKSCELRDIHLCVNGKKPGWFARHLKLPCVFFHDENEALQLCRTGEKPYCKWWYCTCRPHWYLCIFVVCIDAVCIDACIPGGDHQMSCFVVCYFHNWDFDNRPIGRLAA